MVYGKSIELFLVNGTAESLITAELLNWNGKAIKIPRIEVTSCDRDDLKQAGVYFLFAKEDDGTDAVYIGESENVKDRLIQHMKDYQAEKETYYWNTSVVFIGRDLNKALIRYLENRFVDIAKHCKRYKVLTKNTYQKTVMKESQKAVMEEFIDNVRILINVLGYKVLVPILREDSNNVSIDDEMLFINKGVCNAEGKITTEGFVLVKGAEISEKLVAKSVNVGILKLRKEMSDNKKIIKNITTEDILFSSSSAAADFVLGYSVSGPKTWKTKDGRSLKEMESAEISE